MNKVAPNERNGAKITANTKAEINTTANKAGRGKTSEKLITRNKRWIREGNKKKQKDRETKLNVEKRCGGGGEPRDNPWRPGCFVVVFSEKRINCGDGQNR